MKKLIALFLLFSVTLLTACSGSVPKPPVIITKDAPKALVTLPPEAEKPDMDTGDFQQDFKNVASYVSKVQSSDLTCRSKVRNISSYQNR